jgi:hypothetical protein
MCRRIADDCCFCVKAASFQGNNLSIRWRGKMQAMSHNKQARTGSSASARAGLVAIALAGSLAGLAIMSFIGGGEPAGAEERVSAPALPTASQDVRPFAFGYLEFDWNPANGVAGFDSWPPGAQR